MIYLYEENGTMFLNLGFTTCFMIRNLSYYVLVHWAENDGDRWAQYCTVPFTALQPWTSIFGDTFASERTPKTVMLDLVPFGKCQKCLQLYQGNIKF